MKVLTVSVVVSSYNQEKYIVECIESIVNQERNFPLEVIVSDDCSKDSTPAILKTLETKYKDIVKVIYNATNSGAAKNYFKAHNAATGDLVFHMDGDDVMLPLKLQKQYNAFLNEDVNFCLHTARYFNDDRTHVGLTGGLSSNDPITFFTAQDLACWGTISVHSSYAYRRSSRRTKELPREFMEWFFAMDSLLPNGKGAFINEPLLDYRSNTNGSSYLSSVAGKRKAYGLYLVDLKSYFQDYPSLRSGLLANAIITFLGILKNIKVIDKAYFKFIIKNIFYFRMGKLTESFRIRQQAAPKYSVK